MMQQDLRHKLREAQRHLVEAARSLDGASVNIRTLLEQIDSDRGQGQAPYSPKGNDDDRNEPD